MIVLPVNSLFEAKMHRPTACRRYEDATRHLLKLQNKLDGMEAIDFSWSGI